MQLKNTDNQSTYLTTNIPIDADKPNRVILDSSVYTPLYSNPFYPSYMVPYGGVTVSGTQTGQYLDLVSDFKINREYYFDTKKYESIYSMSSKEMFDKWKKGLLSSPDYSEWVNAYITIWDKVNAPGYIH